MDREKKNSLKQRRLKSSSDSRSARIFTDEEMEMTVKELARLEKEKSEENGSRRRVRRLKKKQRNYSESCPLFLGEDSLFADQQLVKEHSKKLSTKELNKEKADRDWIQLYKFVEEMDFANNEVQSPDFEGNFEKDQNSAFRKRIRRIKVSETDPIILGRILAGCSVNILYACFAATSGLKWREVDSDESIFLSVTNQELTIVGQTTAFVKLEVLKHPVKLD